MATAKTVHSSPSPDSMPQTGDKIVTDLHQLLVIGVGNDLRQDDGVGLHLARRFGEHFNGRLTVREEYGPDISLSQVVAQYRHLLIIDAMTPQERPGNTPEPFVLIPLTRSENFVPTGFTSHIFNWPQILAAAHELFHAAPATHLLGITAHDFGISQDLTPNCLKNAESAFQYMTKHYF